MIVGLLPDTGLLLPEGTELGEVIGKKEGTVAVSINALYKCIKVPYVSLNVIPQ